ncbi:MAG: response regulator [Proteobacteria bacterium]|nr:response regulator [Pseudomonadota bacterium]MBU4287495.1 response regulator [Pseudomonadota bacterium]MBU4413596.1 response regulator [Pseudomonadota bacterium]
MKINQKIIMGFLVVALLILAVSYIGITTQENLVKKSQELAEEILPGAITEAMIQTKLHQTAEFMEKYALSGTVSDREKTEEAIAALDEYMTAHRLYHSGHHPQAYSDMIDETIGAFTSFTMEYILTKDKGAREEELDIVRAKIDQTVNVFISQIEPTLREHIKAARNVVTATKQSVIRSRNFILGSSAVIFSLVLVWGFFISRLISKPIKELSEAAGQIGKGQLDIQIEPVSKDEIGQLAISFNRMVNDLQTITVSCDTFAQEVAERKQAEKALQTAYDQSIIYAKQLKEQIEERTRAEEEKEKLATQLLHAQKMEAVGTLAGGIAHDFNNILQAISGYVQLLLMRKEVKNTERLYLNQIDKSTRKAAELTKQLLIFGRKVESKLIPLSLNQEIIEIYKLFQRTILKMIDIELDLAENLKLINADPAQLEQIMMNLGLNARDAMPDGGKLTFETKNVVLDEVYCRTHVDIVPGEYVLLRISDTGHGMDKEILEHIFEPFYTTKETGKGTGLGLAIVYGLVESHGGHIMCYSEPGQGTIFKIHFPALLIDGIEQELEPEEKVAIHGGHETVLIVDDEEDLRDQGRDMLNKYGYTAITAESGEMAIEIYEKEKDRINLVILDIGMPGMGGYKCLGQLFKVDPEIKVIIASGYATSDRMEEMLKFGAADFIDKPYRLTDMLKKVREVLDQG